MRFAAGLLFLALALPGCFTADEVMEDADVKAAQAFLDRYNTDAAEMNNKEEEASWNVKTDITDAHEQALLQQQIEVAEFSQKKAEEASALKQENLDASMKRQLKKIMDIGEAAMKDKEKYSRLKQASTKMESIYGKAKVCLDEGKPCLNLEPDLTRIMSTSRDYNRLLDVWKGWRDATGPKMKQLFQEYVTLKNEALALLGYKDAGEYWKSKYESDTFEDDIRNLYEQLRPLYEHLHAYVRRKLKAVYGEDKFPSSGHIPAHLFGNMWAQEWNSLQELLVPFKNKNAMDVTDELVNQGYTAKRLFETADGFFSSLGLFSMSDTFWEKSMIVKPTDGREVVCHASAWDFYKGDDFRIKMCTDITQEDLITVHHEMGHVEYYMQYKQQPIPFRGGANPGFHEAVGDTMALSVQTPKHMKTLNLIDKVEDDRETDINFLMGMALQKVAFIPFGLLMDKWRWAVFRGDVGYDDYTKAWWDLRCQYQGISSPVERSATDFDPGAKYHIPADVPYIRYFVSFVIQFQFHEALCKKAGHVGPLHLCDIYNNTEAGKLLSDMLKMGSSKPWPDAMEKITGQRKMDARPMMEYFQPLLEFLKQENQDDHGWEAKCPPPPPPDGASRPDVTSVLMMSLMLLVGMALR